MTAKTYHAKPVRGCALANLVRQLGYYNIVSTQDDDLEVAVFTGDDSDAERVRKCRFVESVEEYRGGYIGLKRTG